MKRLAAFLLYLWALGATAQEDAGALAREAGAQL